MIFFIMYIYINICISIFAKHHTFITCEYILSFCLFFFVFTYTGLLIFFCYKLVLMFFLSFFMSGMKFRQTDMFCACNDDQRPCVAYVWFVVILSFLFFVLLTPIILFFLYVDCSSYFMYKIRYVLDKRKEFILARKMSKWDYYYYYCLVSVNI